MPPITAIDAGDAEGDDQGAPRVEALHGRAIPTSLNESHQRRILSTFVYADKLLQTIERLAASKPSPFAHEQPDLTEAESRLLLALVDRARQRMLAALDRFGIPRPRATNSSRWSADTALQFADISISELDAGTLRGYGRVDEQDALEVAAVANDLRELIERGRRLLRPREGEGLQKRLEAITGRAGEILRELSRLTTAHGIVELRTLISAAADRVAARSFDVGVFGRVSSGKSSLINALVGQAALPVGATPVTAVPLRLRRGDSRVVIRYEDGRVTSDDIASLPNYATEERNPQNEKEIVEIVVTLPAIEEGLTLLDTPGVGSLSLSGPAQTFAALPRCDLGLVLAAAGTPLGQDELSLISALHHAGIAAEVLLSKSDLLTEIERERALDYLRHELRYIDPRGTVPVFAVSAVPAGASLLVSWREKALSPLVAARQESSLRALRRRLEALIFAADSAIATREKGASDRTLDAQKSNIAAESTIERITTALERAVPQALEEAAEAIARAWATGGDAHAAARAALRALPADALAQVRAAADALSGGAPETGGHLPPVFDPPLLESLEVHASASMLDRVLGRVRARQQIAGVQQALTDAFNRYASRLRAWGAVRLRERVADLEATGVDDASHLTPELARIAELLDEARDEELIAPAAAPAAERRNEAGTATG
ncbi:MAG TPA: dynamin family protein [Gemmatimonadaceae bacterium]